MTDQLEFILNNTNALIYIVDLESYEVVYANKRCLEEFDSPLGKKCYKAFQKNQESACKFCSLSEEKSSLEYNLGDVFEWEYQNTLNEKFYLYSDRIISWKNSKKAILKIAIDVGKIKEDESEILQLAYYDSLTGLANRVLLHEFIQKSMTRSNRTGEYNALLFLDLDNFKMINDTFGHHVGDSLLVQVAKELKKNIRENDVAARIGGDEFVILIDTSEINLEIVKQNLKGIIQKILSAIKLIKCSKMCISASIGVSLFNNNKLSSKELLIQADSAMYSAKKKGRDTFCFFE